jgi:hypothetical protein
MNAADFATLHSADFDLTANDIKGWLDDRLI